MYTCPSINTTANKTMSHFSPHVFFPLFYWLPTTWWVFWWHKDSPFNVTYSILYQSHVQLAVKCLWWLWEHQMSCNWPLIALSSVNLLAKIQLSSAVHNTVNHLRWRAILLNTPGRRKGQFEKSHAATTTYIKSNRAYSSISSGSCELNLLVSPSEIHSLIFFPCTPMWNELETGHLLW